MFAIDRDDCREIRDHNLYGHGGNQVVGGTDRKNAAYQALNFLRILYLYAASVNFQKRFTVEQAFEWATENIHVKCASASDPNHVKILSDKKIREALKVKIYQ